MVPTNGITGIRAPRGTALRCRGWQQEAYEDNDFHTLPLQLERKEDGTPLTIDVAYPEGNVTAQIWSVQAGRVRLYLLDTNLTSNSRGEDRDITDQLYGGDKEMRIRQEILLGIGVNACFIPLHTWLPDTYPKANFVASVFLCVYTTKAAVYLLARAQPGSEYIAFMGALMAVFGVGFAVFQNDMRRLLSYHIISQVATWLPVWGSSGGLGRQTGERGGHQASGLFFRVDQEFLDVFGDLLFHFLEDTLGLILGKVSQKVGRFAGRHLFDDVRARDGCKPSISRT
jgi:hypothetical protein